MQSDVKIKRSNGQNGFGGTVYFIRPVADCMNRSRKVVVMPGEGSEQKIEAVIRKWYFPKVIIYSINGWRIGSNSKENALKEYWKVCDKNDVGKQVEVTQA